MPRPAGPASGPAAHAALSALQEGLEILPEAKCRCSARGNSTAMNPKVAPLSPRFHHYPAAEASMGPPHPLLAAAPPLVSATPVTATTTFPRSAAAVSLLRWQYPAYRSLTYTLRHSVGATGRRRLARLACCSQARQRAAEQPEPPASSRAASGLARAAQSSLLQPAGRATFPFSVMTVRVGLLLFSAESLLLAGPILSHSLPARPGCTRGPYSPCRPGLPPPPPQSARPLHL